MFQAGRHSPEWSWIGKLSAGEEKRGGGANCELFVSCTIRQYEGLTDRQERRAENYPEDDRQLLSPAKVALVRGGEGGKF